MNKSENYKLLSLDDFLKITDVGVNDELTVDSSSIDLDKMQGTQMNTNTDIPNKTVSINPIEEFYSLVSDYDGNIHEYKVIGETVGKVYDALNTYLITNEYRYEVRTVIPSKDRDLYAVIQDSTTPLNDRYILKSEINESLLTNSVVITDEDIDWIPELLTDFNQLQLTRGVFEQEAIDEYNRTIIQKASDIGKGIELSIHRSMYVVGKAAAVQHGLKQTILMDVDFYVMNPIRLFELWAHLKDNTNYSTTDITYLRGDIFTGYHFSTTINDIYVNISHPVQLKEWGYPTRAISFKQMKLIGEGYDSSSADIGLINVIDEDSFKRVLKTKNRPKDIKTLGQLGWDH